MRDIQYGRMEMISQEALDYTLHLLKLSGQSLDHINVPKQYTVYYREFGRV